MSDETENATKVDEFPAWQQAQMRAAWDKWNSGAMDGGPAPTPTAALVEETLIKDALELCGTRYELQAGYKHHLLKKLAHALQRTIAERDAQHAEVLRLTAERDAAQAKIDRILDPPIKRMNMADGEINVVFDAPEMARIIATTFWDCLDEHKAKNYVEMSFASPESPTKRVVVTVRKLIGRTPEELREAVAKERDLLTEENARLQKERDDALAMETDTARRSSAEIDSLKAELNEAQSETEDLNRRVAELLAQRNEARQEADRRLDMVGDLMRLAWQLRAHIATLELLRRGGK